MDDFTKGADRFRGSPVVMCEVYRVDPDNAVCTTASHDCSLATAYGNYCEHAQVYQLGEFIMPGDATFPCPHQRDQAED